MEQAPTPECPVVKPIVKLENDTPKAPGLENNPQNDTPRTPGLENKPQIDTPRTPGLENKPQEAGRSESPDVGAQASPEQENQGGQAAATALMARLKLRVAQRAANKDGQKAGSAKKSAPAKPKKTAVEILADMPRPTVEAVHAALKELGVDDPESVNKCLKRAIQVKYVQLDSEKGLDKVIFKDNCFLCNDEKSATVRDLLYQPEYAGLDYEDGGQNAPIKCDCEGDENGLYVTRLCHAYPEFDSGKFHNHCTECPGFGTCIGDYRTAHCERCGEHYFAGLSGFPCDCRGRFGDDDDDEYDSDEGGRPRDPCNQQ